MNGTKKLLIRILLILYGLSYFLQNSFFVDRKTVYAAGDTNKTNIIAVFVDKDIYQDIKNNLERYTVDYIQKKVSNSKAVVFPIDTKQLKAHEISQMLENMYFEGVEGESSELVGTILIGNIPLPVVENEGFVYPSIFPYVDFEHQQFIYDTNKKFFVYNDNPNGQAEIRHGLIQFDTSAQYNDFFEKVRTYTDNPTDFVDKTIWYDDFIGLKKYFIAENTKYYTNGMIFSEDIGYHRFTPLLLDTLTSEHNSESLELGSELTSNLENVEDQDLQEYAEMIKDKNTEAQNIIQSSSASLPTMTLMKSTQEMLKSYDGLISTMFQSKIKDNIAGIARRYKNTEGESYTDINGTTDKINQQDNRIRGDLENNVQGILIQINDYMEEGLNDKIEQEKYYLTVPIPVEYLQVQGEEKKGKCTRPTYNYFHNYYFGKDVNFLESAQDTSIYRGTYQNLTTLSGQAANAPLQSIGGSFKTFSTQVEANRGYNIGNAENELELYNKYKTNKQELRGLNCTKYLFNREWLNICIKKRIWKPDDSDTEDKCNINDTEQQGGCETLSGFAQRNRGGASPLALDANMNLNYDYKEARLPIYDIAGSREITLAQPEANTSSGVQKYAALIQNKLGAGDLQYSNNLSYLIKYPQLQGNDLLFANQYPYGNLKDPTRGTNPPKTYAQTDFFTTYATTTSRTISANKAVLYNWTNATDIEKCNVKGEIYTYKTLDSRIMNISPTRDQISDTVFFKFKTGSDIYQFYTESKEAIQQTSNDIIEKATVFGSTTGVIGNLTKVRNMINSGNNGIQTILSSNIGTPAGAAALASQRDNLRLNQSELAEISGNLKEIRDGLNDLLDYINTVSIAHVQYLIENIIQFEKYKNQNVEIVDTRKTELTNELNTINTNIAILKAKFLQAQNIYNSIVHIQNPLPAIIAKRTTIAASNFGNGCNANNYLALCNVLDNIISLGNLSIISDTNDFIDEIESYQTTETNQGGGFITVEPFIEINNGFVANEIGGEVNQVKTIINTFDISTDPEKTETKKGMNLTTADRPIDNIRNITFKGIGGDNVRLNYPNLYEVEVYKKSEGKLILKSSTEIKDAIKRYLTNKAKEYNTILEAQKNKKNNYYASFSAQFTFLGQLDALANPNTHNYNLLPADFFINRLVSYLEKLQQEYGNAYIYGKNIPTTTDDKIQLIAEFLYQQNMARPQKLEADTVVGSINESKASFDINYRISNAIKTYLQENNDQGSFLTPTYNNKGYEVGFINSDGKDYVSAKSVPSFIKQIQTIQSEQTTNEKQGGGGEKTANAYIQDETQTNDLQQSVDSCEGVDVNGTSLLFDFKTFTFPWVKAMKCRGQKIFEKPFDIQVSFKQALGPTVMGSLTELQNTMENYGTERKKYGDQRNTPDNQDIIAQATGITKEKLQGYNTNALVDIQDTIMSVEDTGTNDISISALKNMGEVKIRITGIGDNCFSITKKNTVVSNDICQKPVRDVFNPYTEPTTFKLQVDEKKAGSTSVQIEVCLPNVKDDCIIKSKTINILPGPIQNISLTSPDIVMEGSQIPLGVIATDAYGNQIGQTVESYTISVLSGNGTITDGSASNTNIEFNNFTDAGFIYQAPTGLTANKSVSITITPKKTDQKLLAIQPTVDKKIQKNVIVAKGIVTVKQGENRQLYKTKTDQQRDSIASGNITFKLPKDEEQIQYIDAHEVLQIVPENLPSFTISVVDPNGHKLDTVANITTSKGLLTVGKVVEKNIKKGNATYEQIAFTKNNDFLIEDGELQVTLYPSFKAGDDTLTIQIPGLDPITIPITVYAGDAKKVLLTLEKSKLDLTTTTTSKGLIQIVDTWNNKVNTPTAIKLGTIGAAKTNTTEFTYSGGEYEYTLTTQKPGGEGYVFAYIKDRQLSDQFPGYERFIIQESILPKEKLNVMYLSLFGTDRGNQRGYFSENEKTINTITAKSNKLLATTTELVDPMKIKQMAYIINQNGQIKSINDESVPLSIEDGNIIANIAGIADITLGQSNEFRIESIEGETAVNDIEKDRNLIIYIPEPTDSVITGNESDRTTITINGQEAINIEKGTIDPAIAIKTDAEAIDDMSTYTITLNSKTIGKMMIWNNVGLTTEAVNIIDPLLYGKIAAFSEGSTNSEGIGIYLQSSAFEKKGFKSIEDSSDPLLGIGFTDGFKNITNFANGKIVGEATLPYGSQFLINFGDPLLERRDKNAEIPNTDFDASIGQTIYADPNKTILKVLPIDFNNDKLKDLLIVYTDGTVKLLKNYGGKESYKNLQELMIIAEPIKDIIIGDVDGNKYDDIMIMTTNKKGLVYLNDKGIFAVDGKNVCLNISPEVDIKNATPEDFSPINQLFIEDMDQDGVLDIITNDIYNNATIFYGGETNDAPNYLSTITGTCDTQRYQRQKDNYTVVKRFGMRVNSNRRIQDASLVHWKGAEAPKEGKEEEVDEEEIDTSSYSKEDLIEQTKNFTQNLNEYIAQGAEQLEYVENPLSTSPTYETADPEEIYYLPINGKNGVVSIYKEYKDMNGGILQDGDDVAIQTTFIATKSTKLTYIDLLKGPRKIVKDKENKITSLVITQGNTGNIAIDRNAPEGYQFVMDNIVLNSGQKLSFSYTVTYQQQEVTKIDVKDIAFTEENKEKDIYPEIIITSTDPCQKGRRLLFNEKTGKKRTYEQFFDDIQAQIDEYYSGAQNIQTKTVNDLTQKIGDANGLEKISSLPGVAESLESRKNVNMLTPKAMLTGFFDRAASQGGGININMNFIDAATSKVSKKIDEGLDMLCQGFSVGNGGCQGVPVPFNQAFLAPGNYHVFGCVPKVPNPLYVPFKLLNQTLGQGLPVLAFPTDSPIPVWPPGSLGAGAIFKGEKSQFRLYVAPTLTLGLGIAMCFGPYTLGVKIPKPFGDIGGNCIVFALPAITNCPKDTVDPEYYGPKAETQDIVMKNAASQGTCNNPPKISSTTVFNEDTAQNEIVFTPSAPFEVVSAGVQDETPYYGSMATTQGNFGGLVEIDYEPITVTSTAGDTDIYDGYELKPGEKTNLKIIGGKGKGLVQCIVKDRFTRQIQYIQNNLTKMTLQLDLPDVTTVFQGFDKIGNLAETYEEINRQDKQAGYTQVSDANALNLTPNATGTNATGGVVSWTKYLSKQQLNSISDKYASNPFEAIQKIFQEVPLVNIDSKEINIKIPALTTDDIKKYQSYLTLRIDKNSKIVEDRTTMLNEILALCGTTSKEEAQQNKADLEAEFNSINDNKTKQRIEAEIKDMDKILTMPQDTTAQQIRGDVKNIGINMKNTAKQIVKLPYRKVIQGVNATQKLAMNKDNITKEQQARFDRTNARVANLEKCSSISAGMSDFLSFSENTASLIQSVKQNINVLEQYKQFPTQLYERTHITDRYLTELSAVLSEFMDSTTYRLNTNANRFSSYVDALITLVGAIKTWQAIIDFSVNRSEKCSKCSNDNYGSFSCSLSFLCPKLPIFPIPAFKIPSIYMDMSHIDLGMNIILPKINFVPIKIPLPQLPDIPEPPSIEVNRDSISSYGLDINFMEGMSMPTIPVIPEPPTLPEPPSFIPSVKIDLPVLPPAPKIPKILPEINGVLKVADFIGKIFCIVKGGIGLVGEKSVKGKIEQMTQRTRNVPIFDTFNLTTKYKDTPLQGFDYKLDAYLTLKFNFDGVYDVFNNIANASNAIVSKGIEAPINKAMEQATDTINNNRVTDTGFEFIEGLDQDINFNGYNTNEGSGLADYRTIQKELKQGLITFQNSTLTDKAMNDRVKTILATVENSSKIAPATQQIQEVAQAAQGIITKQKQKNQERMEEIQSYDSFIEKFKENEIVLVDEDTVSAKLTAPLLTIDSHTKSILQSQEDPTKTYLNLNKKMVEGYLYAINTDGAEKLNMSQLTYDKSKKYLETTKKGIDTALLAYEDKPLLAQSQECTNCGNDDGANNYASDLSAYVQGIFTEYAAETGQTTAVNTVISATQIEDIQQRYTTDMDINNDGNDDIIMYDENNVFIKYAEQETEHFSAKGNSIARNASKTFYSYAKEHPRNRYITSLEQLENNSDEYGYTDIGNINIKVVDKNKEVKGFKTNGQTFDTLQFTWKNSKTLGEKADGYIIQFTDKVDDKDTPSSFWGLFPKKPHYVIVLPKDTEYTTGLITVDSSIVKKPINVELGDSILAVEYYDPAQSKITVTLKDMPRKRLYANIASLTISQEDLTANQRERFTLYKKTSPRSNQTVAGVQNLGDVTAPVGEIVLRRNLTNQAVSTGNTHEGYINTNYTLKAQWTDNVNVSRMIVKKDGITYIDKKNESQTGTVDFGGLFFTGMDEQTFEFIAIDENDNIAKEMVTLNINIPDIEVIDIKKSGEKTADIIAKISNDMDEGLVIFQRLRNSVRTNLEGTNQNAYGGFELSPNQTIITGGIFTRGNEIGLYDNQGNEIAKLDPKTGEITITPSYKNKIQLHLSVTTHIPVIELRDISNNITLFQLVLPIESITDIHMHQNKPQYEQLLLDGENFGAFNGGYCIKNSKNDCVIYTNQQGSIYIPGVYASSLAGTYTFDTTTKNTTYTIKDQSGKDIVSFTLKIQPTEK